MAIWRWHIVLPVVLALTQAGCAETLEQRAEHRAKEEVRQRYQDTCAASNKTAVGREFSIVLFVNNQVVLEDWNVAPTDCLSWETACPTIGAALGKLRRHVTNQTVLVAVASTLRPYEEPVLCGGIRRKRLVIRGGHIPHARCEEDWDPTYTTHIHLPAARHQGSAVSVRGFEQNVTISNFTWRGNGRPVRVGGTQTRVRFRRCVFNAVPLWVSAAKEVWADSCTWVDSTMWFGGMTQKVTIDDCTVEAAGSDGMGFMSVDEVTVRNTVIKNNVWTTGAYPGLFFGKRAEGITLDRVTFVGNRVASRVDPSSPFTVAAVMSGRNVRRLRDVRFFNNTDGEGKSIVTGVYAHDLGQYLLHKEPPPAADEGSDGG
ncbi:MAG: right-handed parallel beta-helix repeat-containing protein [Myxococcota bacterium]